VKKNMTPDEVLHELLEGNKRYMANDALRPRQCLEQRASLVEQQAPSAVIVGCSDSRVPAEIVFDQGLGDLFIVRVAGGVLGPVVIGSIEYAVQVLQVALIVVLGHQRCGAVTAAVQAMNGSTMQQFASAHLDAIMHELEPSVLCAHKAGITTDLVDAVTHEHIARNVQVLNQCAPIIAPAVASKKLKIVGAYYDLATGRVELV
jgi:carbonic anhydrase